MVILTSATLDEKQLAATFCVDLDKQFIWLDVVQTDNKLDYPKENPLNITEYIVQKVRQHEKKNILIFMPFGKPISMLVSKLKTMFPNTDVYPLATANFEKIKAEILSTPVKPRIIVSTNLMESGITLDYLDVVIDSGYELTAKFNPYSKSSIINFYDVTPKDKVL